METLCCVASDAVAYFRVSQCVESVESKQRAHSGIRGLTMYLRWGYYYGPIAALALPKRWAH